jgi:hypothetical protein
MQGIGFTEEIGLDADADELPGEDLRGQQAVRAEADQAAAGDGPLDLDRVPARGRRQGRRLGVLVQHPGVGCRRGLVGGRERAFGVEEVGAEGSVEPLCLPVLVRLTGQSRLSCG